MRYNILLIIFFFLLWSFAPLCACNEDNLSCVDALTLTELNTNGTFCLTSCNEGQPNQFYKPSMQGCEASPFSTIWYHIEAGSNLRLLSIDLSSSDLIVPLVSIYSNNCTAPKFISCNQGFDGKVELSEQQLLAGQEYWIALADGQNNKGGFDLCLTIQDSPNVCNTDGYLEVVNTSKGSPSWGPYEPGEQVEYCYSIPGYTKMSCNYLHGIVPLFGNGWDQSSFDADGQPISVTQKIEAQGRTNFTTANPVCEGELAGEWLWYPEGQIRYSLNSENPLGLISTDYLPGAWVFLNSFDPTCFNFDDACCTNPTSDPNQGYGDDNYPICFGASEHEWKVCFELTSNSLPTATTNDCTVALKTMSDGETGTLINKDCKYDRPHYRSAAVVTCKSPQVTISEPSLTICAGQEFQINFNADQPNSSFWIVDKDEQVTVLESNTFSGMLAEEGTYRYEVYASNGCHSESETFVISVSSALQVTIEQQPANVCPGEEVSFIAQFDDSYNVSDLSFTWDDDTASSDVSIVVNDVNRTYTLDLDFFGCTASAQATIQTYDQSQLVVSGEKDFCDQDMTNLRFELSGLGPWVINIDDGLSTVVIEADNNFIEYQLSTEEFNMSSVSAIDGNGCEVIITGDVDLDIQPELIVNAGEDIFIDCNTSSAELMGSMNTDLPNYTLTWTSLDGHDIQFGETMNPIVTEPGLYMLEVIDNVNGCSDSDVVMVAMRPDLGLVLDTNMPVEITAGEAIELVAFVSVVEEDLSFIEWTDDGTVVCPTCLQTEAFPTETTTYILTIEDNYGCYSSVEFTVIVRQSESEESNKIYIPNTFDPQSLSGDDVIRVYGDNNIAIIKRFEIYDRWGGQLFIAEDVQPDDPQAAWKGIYNGTYVKQGVYLYNITLELSNGLEEAFAGTITVVN